MEESKRQRNSGLLDLWEHACLLYHSFEWQSAADTFSHLANVSTDPTDQRTFALNRGLIEARLGDFDLASVSFAKALSLDNDDPIAHFLLGLVSVELDDHSTGYAHFRRTLERLPAGALDNRTRVLDFGLARSAVEEDAQRVLVVLKAGKDKVGKAKAMPLCLHSIPAELIFEAPPRPTATSQAGRTSVDNQVSSTTSRSDARFTRDPKTPVTAKKSNSAVDTASKANIDTAEIGSDGQLPGTSLARPLPPKRLSPRDAQIRDGSTKELARFLRHAGPSGVAEITVDRLYLQRLMQGYNNLSTVPRAHGQAHDSFDTAGLMTPLTGPHDGLESLLDLDIVNRPERGGLSSDAGVQKNVSRKPLPGAVVNLPLAIDDASHPRIEATHSSEIPLIKRRRQTLETAQRWLRKEAKTPWTRNHDKTEQTRPEKTSSPSSACASDNASKKPVPSTVSSTEIFRFGLPRKRLGSR